MGDLQELFGVNSEQALRFFIDSLREETLPVGIVEDETYYVASVLAHYAQTPRGNDSFVSPGNLAEVFESSFLPGIGADSPLLTDPGILEIAGSQTLLLAGFFRDQIGRRRSADWYDWMGQSFYVRASDSLQIGRKKILLQRIAEHFPVWARTCQGLSRNLRDNYFLFHPSSPQNP